MRCERTNAIAMLHMEAGKANAMDRAFLDALDAIFGEFEESDAKAAVLVGYGAYFSAGLSLTGLQPLARDDVRRVIEALHRVFLRIFRCPRPIVAAVNGHAIAGGCALALLADHRVAAAGPYKIGLSETSIGVGLPPIVVEPARLRVPASSWNAVMLEGRLFDPSEALGRQLVDEVVAADRVIPVAAEVAHRLADVPQHAFRQVKQRLRAPTVAALADVAAEHERWLDTWFAPETRRLHEEAVARMRAKRSV